MPGSGRGYRMATACVPTRGRIARWRSTAPASTPRSRALAEALFLGLIAPDAEKAQAAAVLAEQIAAG